MSTPTDAEIIQAAAAGHIRELAMEHPGASAPVLAREALRLADDPQAVAAHPRATRVIRERRDASRAARSSRGLTVRVEG